MSSKLSAIGASAMVGVTFALASRKHLLIALCAVVVLATTGRASHSAPVFDITGVPQNGFTYGSAPGDDNVVNSNGVTSTGSTVVDTGAAPSTWLGSGLDQNNVFVNSFVSATGFAPGQKYFIAWTYVGSESDDVIQFSAPGGASTTNEDDRNNNCATCSAGPGRNVSTVPMGSTAYNYGDIPAFTVTDTNQIAGSVTNGGLNPAPANFFASLIFSYATFDGSTYTLTSDPTLSVVFAFNDNGFGDDNHDDFVGVMQFVVCSGGCGQETTPIPAALPLFATGLGALGVLGWRRKRKAL